MTKPVTIHIDRPRLDDDPIRFTVGIDGGIAGCSFLLTVMGVGTIAGSITDGAAGYVEFDPTNALDEASAPLNLTELAVGIYTYYVVMTNTVSDERTICQGVWTVAARGS